MADEKKWYSSLQNLFDKIWSFAGKSISVLVAFMFMIFALGSLFGYFIAMHSSLKEGISFLLLVPPILGMIAYYYRTFAIICFIAFLILILI